MLYANSFWYISLLAFMCPLIVMEMIPYHLGDTMIMVDSRNLGLSQPVIDLLKKGLPSRAKSAIPEQLLEKTQIPQSTHPNIEGHRLNELGLKRLGIISNFDEEGRRYKAENVSSNAILTRIVHYLESEVNSGQRNDIKNDATRNDFVERKIQMNKERLFDDRTQRPGRLRNFLNIIEKLKLDLDKIEIDQEIINKFQSEVAHLQKEKIAKSRVRPITKTSLYVTLENSFDANETQNTDISFDDYIKRDKVKEMHLSNKLEGKTTIVYFQPRKEKNPFQKLSSRANSQIQSPIRIFINGKLVRESSYVDNMQKLNEKSTKHLEQRTPPAWTFLSEFSRRSDIPDPKRSDQFHTGVHHVPSIFEEEEKKQTDQNDFLNILEAWNLKLTQEIDEDPEINSELLANGNENNDNDTDAFDQYENGSQKNQRMKTNEERWFFFIPKPTCQCGLLQQKRIIGGENARIVNNPWIAQLIRRSTGIHFCGGTLINDRIVMTAAHCVSRRRPWSFYVKLGSARRGGGLLFGVRNIFVHEGYISNGFENDIALVRLSRVLRTYSLTILPICLPKPSTDFNLKDGIIAGWGSTDSLFGTKPIILQEAKVKIWNRETCIAKSNFVEQQIFKEQICAREENTDSCDGDSGGPLSHATGLRHYQAGITSVGFDCAKPKYPGIYTRVQSYLNWITEKTTGAIYCFNTGRQNTIAELENALEQAEEDDATIADFLTDIVDNLQNETDSANSTSNNETQFNATVITVVENTENASGNASKFPGFGLQPVEKPIAVKVLNVRPEDEDDFQADSSNLNTDEDI